jgi:hypothetical protein
MPDFNPEDFVVKNDTEFNPEDFVVKSSSETSEFNPEDFVVSSTTEESSAVAEDENDPAFISSAIKRAKLQEISGKYGIPEEELIKHVYARGGTVEGETRPLSYAASLAGEALPVSAGAAWAFAQKKMAPESQRAGFDELADEVGNKRSYARVVGEMAMGLMPFTGGIVGVPAKVAAKVGGSALKQGLVRAGTAGAIGASIGAGASVTQSAEGQEAKDAVVGALLGGALGGAVEGVLGKAPKLAKGDAAQLEVPASKTWQVASEKAAKSSAEDAIVLSAMKEAELPEAKIIQQRLSRGSKGVRDDEGSKAIRKFEQGIASLKNDNPEGYEKLVTRGREALNEKQVAALEEMAQRKGVDVNDAIAVRAMTDETKDFVKYLYGDNPEFNKFARQSFTNTLGLLSKARHEFGGGIDAKWDAFRAARLGQDLEVRAQIRADNLRVNDTWLQKMGKTLLPSRYAMGQLDRKWGTGLVKLVDDMSMKLNNYKNMFADMQPLVDASHKLIKQEAKVAGKSLDDSYRLLHKFTNGELAKEEAAKVAEAFPQSTAQLSKNWETYRLAANKLAGYDEDVIKRWGDRPGQYAPEMAKPFKESAAAIIEETARLHNHGLIASLTDEDKVLDVLKVLQGAEPELATRLNSVRDSLKYVMPQAEFNTMGDLRKGFSAMERLQNSTKLNEQMAKASHIRTGGRVPALIREIDPVKLQERYLMNTLKHMALDNELTKMRGVSKFIQQAGQKGRRQDFKADYEYVNNAVKDLMGKTRSEDTMNSWLGRVNQQVTIGFLEKAAKAETRWGKGAWKLAAEYPELLRFMGSQLYPSVLSAVTNPIATIVNFTQPMAYSMPELGFQYGSSRILKGYLKAMRNPRAAFRELRDRGFKGAEWSTELSNSLDEATGTVRSELGRKAARVVNGINSITMKPFEIAELFNRAVVLEASKEVAKDMLNGTLARVSKEGADAGSAGAMKFFERLPDSYKRSMKPKLDKYEQLSDSFAKGNTDAAKELRSIEHDIETDVAKYLIGKTIFNYDKASASELARTVAPMLMTFTKFPLNVIGDVAEQIETKGVAKGLGVDVGRRLILPALALYAGDQVLQEYDDEVIFDMSMRELLAGKSKAGLLRYSIGAAAPAMLAGQWASPPVMSPFAALAGALTGNEEMAIKEAKETGRFFLPAPLTNAIALWDMLAAKDIVDTPPWDEE